MLGVFLQERGMSNSAHSIYQARRTKPKLAARLGPPDNINKPGQSPGLKNIH